MTPVKSDMGDTLQLENLLITDSALQTPMGSEDYLDGLAPLITEALKTNGLADFITRLNGMVKDKDLALGDELIRLSTDIRTCIDGIDQVSLEAEDLGRTLQQLNTYLNRSTLELVSKKQTLIKKTETARKISETIEVLNLCLQVLEITNKIHDWTKQHRYFSALKLIDELTSIHLPKVRDFLFLARIRDLIPHFTAMIKAESFDNSCKWLAMQIERKVDAIGDALFNNLADLNEAWDLQRSARDALALLPHRLNSAVELALRDPALVLDIFDSRELSIDLAPLYDCILVYQSLGELLALKAAWHKEWMKKYQRVIYPLTLSLAELAVAEQTVLFSDLDALEAYLRRIAAFFIADKAINTRTRFELRLNSTADDLWVSFAIKLRPMLNNFLETRKWGLADLNELADFKDVIGNFSQVMENERYDIHELADLLIVIFRDHFGPILIQHFRLEFLESIQSDHFMPLVVTDKVDYDNVMKICWYKQDSSFAPRNLKSMPISFPFSEDYVHYCLGMRTLLQDVLDFTTKHYSTDLAELNQIIIENIFEKVLGDTPGVGICSDIRSFITKNASNKEIIAQTYTNLEYYLFSLYEIGKMIDRRLRAHNGIGIINIDTNSTFKLKAIELFAKVRKFSEDAIFKMVDQKVGELLDMVEYDDWFPSEQNKDPNFFIQDFSTFLENLFTSIFSNLPSSFRTLGLFRSFDFISEYFRDLLANAELFNRIAILNFDLDVKHLEQTMARLAEDTEDKSVALQQTFAELRQSIDLLLLEDYEEFKTNPSFRMRRFDRLKFDTAVALTLKMRNDDVNDDESVYTADASLAREPLMMSTARFKTWGKLKRDT